MSPLIKGTGNIRKNVQELMTSAPSPSRAKAIQTIAKTRNISQQEARFVNAKAIATAYSRKK